MKKQERLGIGFGFNFLIIWLIILSGLTLYLTCDKLNTVKTKTINTIVLPPLVELEGDLYE